MASHTVVINTRPRPKQRARSGKGGRHYTPSETVAFEAAVSAAWRDSDGPFFEGPVEVWVDLWPEGVAVTIRDLDPEEKSRLPGDIDNYLKSVFDGLNRHAFKDDRQVLRVAARKGNVAPDVR